MSGQDLEKIAQQNRNWSKTGFSTPTQATRKAVEIQATRTVVEIEEENNGSSLTKREIKILRSALYLINGHYFSSCNCEGCKPSKEETQKLFHDLDRLIKKYQPEIV